MKKGKKSKRIMYVIAFLFSALVIAVLLPAFQKPNGTPTVWCKSHMRQLAISCELYNEEYNTWPDKKLWNDALKDLLGDNDTFQCFRDKVGPCSYAMNAGIPADANTLPADLVVFFESAPGWNQVGGPQDVVTDRHDQKKPGANIAFADGQVKYVKAADIPKLRWTLEAK